ncbi:MAG: TIGR03619 family F420-dependent LLM class oxidoreductase [Dehalococcoidia bacterium]|nr:TIGR03619 family F420-dependent LLM class oxidoreductase [Dehalococcoidia bacterium]
MKFGVNVFLTDNAINPAALARAVEERGFESLFFPEHTHIPLKRRSIPSTGTPLTEDYAHMLDPFVAIMAAAAATERLRLATGICLVIQHDPITLAKTVASVDFLSKGRLLFGVGAGWNEEEMENHGTDPTKRFRLMRERIEAMKAIWTQDEASYQGKVVRFDPIWSWPKPVQKPHPPILVGGAGPHALKRVVDFGDEWLPTAREFKAERIAELQEMAARAGRGRIPVSVFAAPPNEEAVTSCLAAGVDRCIFRMGGLPEAEAIRTLDDYAKLAAAYAGA